jgi:hypothetical protein
VTYAHDAAGRGTRLTWPGSSTYYVDYDYLTTGEMIAMRENGATSGAGVLATFGYDALGRRSSLARGNGVTTAYGYTGPLLSSIAHDLPGSSQDLTITMLYNKAMQIVSRTGNNDAYAWTGHGSGTSNYAVNGLNRMTSIDTPGVGTTTETFDQRGNLASANHWGVRSFAWSSENLLKTETQPNIGTFTFGYDPLMRWTSSSAYGGHQLAYDGDRMILDAYTLYGATRYIHGPGTDEPLALSSVANGTRGWYLADERGTVIAYTDASGAASGIYAYDENGVSSTQPARFGYTGQQ